MSKSMPMIRLVFYFWFCFACFRKGMKPGDAATIYKPSEEI